MEVSGIPQLNTAVVTQQLLPARIHPQQREAVDLIQSTKSATLKGLPPCSKKQKLNHERCIDPQPDIIVSGSTGVHALEDDAIKVNTDKTTTKIKASG